MFTILNLKIIQSSLRLNQRILSYSTKWKPNSPKVQQEIKQLSKTEQWRNAIDIINRENVTCTKLNVPIFNSLAESAFYDNDQVMGWELLNEISKSGFEPSNHLIKSYWKFCTQNQSQFHAKIEEMLKFIADNRILVTGSVLMELNKSIEPFGGIVHRTRIDYENGNCEQCSGRVNPAKLSKLERKELERQFKNFIVKPMCKPSDIYFFRGHISPQTKKFRYIIDALNVTRVGPKNKGNTVKQGNILMKLIEKLIERGATPGNILIIGKKHIEEWPEHAVNFIQRNATVFLTNSDNKSMDDIFMMYATILSGEKAFFITNDLLPEYPQYFDKEIQEVFKNWQNQHQLLISYDAKEENVKLNKMFQQRTVKDIKSNNWHIPYIDRPTTNFEIYSKLPIKWACMQFNKNKEN